MAAPHAAVKRELLVRYLDAWLPSVLHRHKHVTYVDAYADAGEAAAAALRVFGEFADLLDQHEVTMVLAGADAAALESLKTRLAAVSREYGSPPGLLIAVSPGSLPEVIGKLRGSPMFAWFDSYERTGPSIDAVSLVAGNKASEVLLALRGGVADAPYLGSLTGAGLELVCRVEMVDAGGEAEELVFATSVGKNLEKFKDELWALDEYAGIRLRDPIDDERTLLDISVQPHLGPLRRALAARVGRTGGSTVAELRTWALHETVFRPGDATKAIQALVSTGAVTRDPVGGRLSPATMIRPAD